MQEEENPKMTMTSQNSLASRRHTQRVFLTLLLSFTVTTWFTSALPAQSIGRFKKCVLDFKGREIVPCESRGVHYIGNGLFFLDSADSTNLEKRSGSVVNKDGVAVSTKVPAGCALTNVYLLKASSTAMSQTENIHELPQNAILEICNSHGYGLSNANGKIILEPGFEPIFQSKSGLFLVYRDQKLDFALDAISGQRITDSSKLELFDHGKVVVGSCNANRVLFLDRSGPRPLWGYLDANGKIAIRAKFDSASSFDTEGFASVSLPTTDGGKKICFLIDSDGHRIASPEYESILDFHDGVAVVGTRKANGNLTYGIVNRKFEYVLRPEWTKLYLLFDNVYMAQRTKEEGYIALTAAGKTLFEFPSNTYYVKESDGLLLCYIQKNLSPCLVTDWKDIAVLDKYGKTIFAPSRCKEIALAHGLVVLEQEANSHIKAEKSLTLAGKSGVIGDGIKAWDVEPVDCDRLVAWVTDRTFYPLVWRKEINSRNDQFSNFLRQYDLIGMPRFRVIELLGQPDFRNCYRNYQGMCGSVGGWIEFDYTEDRVTGWRWGSQLYGTATYEPWVRSNVIFDFDPMPRIGGGLLPKVVPKPKGLVMSN